jgi:hypothetical protein
VTGGGPVNGGRRRISNGASVGCLACRIRPAMTRAAARAAVRRSRRVLEVYECPAGLGWHLRAGDIDDPGPGDLGA